MTSTDEGRQLWERVARLEAHYETLTGTLAQALGKLDMVGAGVQRIDLALASQSGSRRVHSGLLSWVGGIVVAVVAASAGVLVTHLWH